MRLPLLFAALALALAALLCCGCPSVSAQFGEEFDGPPQPPQVMQMDDEQSPFEFATMAAGRQRTQTTAAHADGRGGGRAAAAV